jgi:hypothetical protein
MEKEAHDRDQTHWACSAQNSKLLPKRPPQKNKAAVAKQINAIVNPIFDDYEKKYGQGT